MKLPISATRAAVCFLIGVALAFVLYAVAFAHNYNATHQQPAEQGTSIQPAEQVYQIQPANEGGNLQPQFADDGDCTVQCADNPQR